MEGRSGEFQRGTRRILWYVAMAAQFHGYSLEQIAEYNIAKLKARYPDGFDAERSKMRQDSERPTGGKVIKVIAAEPSIFDAIEELKEIRQVALHNWSCNLLSEESEDKAWLSIAAGCESVARSLGVNIQKGPRD
jgi:hypothetical protein